MDEKYLSVDNYLASCGMSQAEVDAIRRNLLLPGAVDGAARGAAAGFLSSSAGPTLPDGAPGGPQAAAQQA
jgi:hypothetical protein